MKEYKTYLFDFDGTLVDSHLSLVRVFQVSYALVGVTLDVSYVKRLMRIPLPQGYRELKAPLEKEAEFNKEIIRMLDDKEVLELTKAYDDVKEVLTTLHQQGKTLGIVTSNNKKHVGEVLNFLDIPKEYFQVIVGNQESKKHKPNPDPVLKALELLNINHENVCYVGDGLDDMTSAKAAGVEAILLDRENEYKNENEIIIKSLKDLL